MVLAVEWVGQGEEPFLRLLDQTRLPGQTVYRDIRTVDALVAAIDELAVRGAPALGAVGALGVVVAMGQAQAEGWDASRLQAAIDRVRVARPTAVNLAWGVAQVESAVPEGIDAVLSRALRVVQDDGAANRELSRRGADWVLERTGAQRVRVLTHCNTGALATTAWGTAYGVIRELFERDRLELVYADETRPLLQGSRLTAWELTQDGIPFVLQVDGAAASTILRGLVDVAVVGADRIAANGDTANKVGTLSVALACARAGIPFVVAAPASTVDLELVSGHDIVVEERDAAEVLRLGGVPVAPAGARAVNPAFDVTPHDLISAIVTERGLVEPATSPAPRLLADIAG